ncbi:Methyltransferase domain-containing protein [Meinhardsimonia xiamenensis]|jgi:SAM-dependent methyltransferase|uniref:Methyltransferase domain-containing protein n=1 Tax=Meinhardsimonia xiamenensis TaxID=990712 RepID=A0A1G9EKD7_9RHOB|nr:class I SAM-dependent methyltransferase [Meinhardsimonia xiamenensis]PRX33733.1 methyltransferase family protein [Meinhardsimonia xiamenensis]SDK76501.1 Methyltransferase domain-containing protein [Meinhardsimonia xiamenensis]
MAADAEHWNAVYGRREETSLSWHEGDAERSFRLVSGLVGPGERVIDVGGGTSRLVDRLVAAGLGPVTVLDLSDAALGLAKTRLGAAGEAVDWVEADVTGWQPAHSYQLWHDRAAFHFLTDPGDQRRYLAVMDAALAPGGHAILITFADDGPERCSGLPVQRWSPEALAEAVSSALPGRFEAVEAERFAHLTPAGATQNFQTSVFRKLREAR